MHKGKLVKHNGSFTLALGEATGHHHDITVLNPVDMEIRETQTGYILILKEKGTLTHQEHGTLKVSPKEMKTYRHGDVVLHPIAPNTWKVGKEREYDWFAKSVRRVID